MDRRLCLASLVVDDETGTDSLGAGEFFGAVLPVAGLSLVLLVAAVAFGPKDGIEVNFGERAEITHKKRLALCVLLFIVCLLAVVRVLPYGAAFAAAGGFDPEYFMYVEDADLTQKMRQKGKVYLVPEYQAVHEWHRAAHRSLRPLWWQLRSMFRYLS